MRRPVSTAQNGLMVGLVVFLGACGDAQDGPSVPPAPLPSGAVARVGSVAIGPEAVQRIAAAQDVEVGDALDRAVFDALLEAGARDGPLASQPSVQARITRALARAVLRDLWEAAQRAPIRPDELQAATDRHWIALDRPAGKRVIHVVVMVDEAAGDAALAATRDLAGRLHAAAIEAAELARAEPAPPPLEDDIRYSRDLWRRRNHDPAVKAFKEAVGGVDAGGARLQVRALAPVAADGRWIDMSFPPNNSGVVGDFTTAVNALESRGDLSPVVETPGLVDPTSRKPLVGYHVILLLGLTPAAHVPEAERRTMLREEILASRAHQEHRALLDRMRGSIAVELASNIDALLAQVVVQ